MSTSRPTILFVTRKYPPAIGGMERQSYELTQRVAVRRRVRIVTRGREPLAAFVARAGCVLLWAGLRRTVGLLHLGDAALAPLAVIAKMLRLPVCVTVHGLDVVHEATLYRWYLRCFFRWSDLYVCTTEAVQEVVVRRGVPAARTVVIGNGIAPPRREPMTARDPGVLLYVGRLVKRKGLAWFVSAVLPTLVARRPDLTLVIIGTGPERPRIAGEAERSGVAHCLRWLGQATEEMKWHWLARASLCIVPNVPVRGDLEGFGIVTLEAAAMATPLVASDLDGLREATGNGAGGILVQPGDPAAWIGTIEMLLDTPDQAAALGERARTWVATARSWDAVCDGYERVFDGLLNART